MKNLFRGLAHICVFTESLDRSVDFYTNRLGFGKVYETIVLTDSGNVRYVVVKLNDCVIELLEPENKTALALDKKGTIDHFAIQVEKLDEIVSHLKAAGVQFTTEIFSFEKLLNGIRGAFIKGPSGELIELFEYQNTKPF